jgi:hypothetical protein
VVLATIFAVPFFAYIQNRHCEVKRNTLYTSRETNFIRVALARQPEMTFMSSYRGETVVVEIWDSKPLDCYTTTVVLITGRDGAFRHVFDAETYEGDSLLRTLTARKEQ